MTTTTTTNQGWASRGMGRVLRMLIGIGGMAAGTLMLLQATLMPQSSWALILLGVGLAATAVRAALDPTRMRLAIALSAIIAVPLVGLII